MKRQTMYQLESQYQMLLELGASDDPAEQQAFLDTLEGLIGEIEIKADSYAVVIDELKAHQAKVNAEIQRLQRMETAIDNSITRMKARIKETMETMGKKEIKTDLHTFKIQPNGGLQKLTITGDVPDKYNKVTVAPDNDKIRKAIADGEQIDFAKLEPRGTQLRIR